MSEKDSTDRPMVGQAVNSRQKPYQAPRLTVYGDLHRIALAKGGDKVDGPSKPMTHL
jgi:hypothetical protein